MIQPGQFQQKVLAWFDSHGRKNLPWQHNKTPYRVWVSEIMLQQTQVQTVIAYYERFMQHFPTLTSLANADENEVLHLWTGLGYYSRARNLHRAAILVSERFNNKLPKTLPELEALPGIGRSTAGAILAIAHQKKASILDGNVKRIISRFFGILEPLDEKNGIKKLWALAERLTPTERIGDYTQALMDLGATVCKRVNPICEQCPLIGDCLAYKKELTQLLPFKKSKKTLPIFKKTFLLFRNSDNCFLLVKRPPRGIWGSLWSLVEMEGEPDKKKIKTYCLKEYKLSVSHSLELASFKHSFTHFHMMIYPVLIDCDSKTFKNGDNMIWYDTQKPARVGLPKPIVTILKSLL